MYRNIKGISRLLIGREDGGFLLAVGAAILIFAVAVYGAVQAGGAMGTHSSSSHQGLDAASAPDTAESRATLDQVQHTHRQGGLPVMTPVLEAGIRAQGAGGPQNLGISYTIGRWLTSIIDWATGRTSGPSNSPAVTADDLGEHTETRDTTADDAGTGGTGNSGGSGGSCNDGCNP